MSIRNFLFKCSVVCALVVVNASQHATAAEPTLTIITSEKVPTDGIFAHNISGDGSTVVGHVRMEGVARAFRWTRKNGLSLLQNFDDEAQLESTALAVSADGRFTVGYTIEKSNSSSKRAAVWVDDKKPVRLKGLDNKVQSELLAISAQGNVVAGQTYDSMSGQPSAFIWSQEKGVRPLESKITMASKTFEGHASVMGISPNGHVCAGSMLAPEINFVSACVWVDGSGAPIRPKEFSVGSLPSFISTHSAVAAVSTNSADEVNGLTGRFYNKNSGRNRGFHIANRVFTWLDNGDGTRMDFPNCISGDGAIVVGSGATSSSDQVACYWNKSRGVVPFQSLVSGSQMPAGLQLTDCSGVSLDGQTFTGSGTAEGGKKVSWVMTVPRTDKR